MMEILHFYTSGFWIWAGLTIGLVIVVGGLSEIIDAVLKPLRIKS